MTEQPPEGWSQTALIVDGEPTAVSGFVTVDVTEGADNPDLTTLVEFGNREMEAAASATELLGQPPARF